MADALLFKDSTFYTSGDESIFPASTLSACSDCDSSSDMTSVLLTARSANLTNLLEENRGDFSANDTSARKIHVVDLDEDLSANNSLIPSPQLSNFFSEQRNTVFMPIPAESGSVLSQRSAPSPGISKMLRSLSDHPSERPCTPNASTLYKNTLRHCNPSELGQQTYDECMFFTQWVNSYLQHSQDKFLITDLARDLGDGLTLLCLVQLLVGEYPAQIHIKPALDVQKMENVQTCLNFLKYYNVSVHGIAAEDIVKGNLKVVLALCHCLYRHFAASQVENRQVHHVPDEGDLALFGWVSEMIGKQIADFQSFQDGTVLCLLINKFVEDAVPNLVLQFGSPFEKVSLVLQVSSEHLGIESNVRTEDITQLRNKEQFLEYLKSLYLLHSRRTKRVPNASVDQTNLKREIKRLQLREQRLKDRHGSELTFLGELSQNKSSFPPERKERYLANTSVDILNSGRSNRLKQLDELEVESPTESIASTAHNKSLPDTNRELDELQEELRLLKLECSDNSYKTRRYWTDQPGQFSFIATSSPGLTTSNLLQRQTNIRRELRTVHRGSAISTLQPLDKMGQKTVGITSDNVGASSRHEALHSDRSNGKLLFGGCYLSEPSGGFENSERLSLKHSFDESSVFTDYPAHPSFLRTFPLQRSSPPLVNSTKVGQNGHVLFPELSLQTKEIGNLFDVDFSDLDARMGRGQEDSAIKRMIRAGNRSKLNSTSSYGLDAGLSSDSAATNANDRIAKSAIRLPLTRDKRERLGTFGGRLTHGFGERLSGITNGDGKNPKPSASSISQQEERERVRPERKFTEIERSSMRGQTNENDKVTSGLPSFFAKHEKEELMAMPLSYLPSERSTKEEGFLSKEKPSRKLSRLSRKPVKQLQRSFSKEKRHREQVLASKSARKKQPSSTKTHLHALTALIRSSARHAGASCSKED